MGNVFMQAATKEDNELLIGTFLIYCHTKKIKISLMKINLWTHIKFGGVEINATREDMLVCTAHGTKLEEVRNFQSSTNKKELQSFLGLAATFHIWNPSISTYLEKMILQNSKGVNFTNAEQWTTEHEEEFQKLKKETC